MYKLLLTTKDPAICNAFSTLPWEMLGFRAPRVVSSVEEAVSSLKRHHADAIAIGLPEEEDAALLCQLMETNPDLPVMAVSDDAGELERYVLELRKILNRVNADMSNTSFTPGEQLQVCRHEFFRALMNKRIPDADTVQRLLRLLRSKMDAHRPCVAAELVMPVDSDFLKGRWHYGSERLELALRNIFGVEVEGLRILSCVLPGDRIVLLGCPMLFHDVCTDGVAMTERITRHVNSCIAHVDEFLGLDLSISDIRVLPSLTAMVRNA